MRVVSKETYSDEETDDDSEDVRLLRPSTPTSDFKSTLSKIRASSETIFDVKSLRNPFDEELENDTMFVVNAINDSHESLCKLVSK